MKNYSIITSLFIIILLISSCGGPTSDLKKALSKVEKFNESTELAVEDGILTEDELVELKNLFAESQSFMEQITGKYKENENAMEEMKEYYATNEIQINVIYGNTDKIMKKMMKCEFPDNFDFSVFR